jgi:23S rRNA (guanosine2251-2'-O)-methyltransferase
MAGNTNRRGAVRKDGTKKGMVVGSGGQRRRALEGRGPTPPAEMRKGHPAQRRAASAAKYAAKSGDRGRPAAGKRRHDDDAPETVLGRNPVVECLRAGVPATALHVALGANADERISEAVQLAADAGIAILEVQRNELDRIAGGALHQGVALQVPPYEYAHPDDLLEAAGDGGGPALIAALDGVTDPRNLGAVVRSASGFGAHGVVIPERRAARMTASAWKTSAGAAARIPVAQVTNLVRTLKEFQDAGCQVVGLAADGDLTLPDLLADPELASGALVVVVGSEGEGLGRLVGETCDRMVSIPMASSLESLNAGVAASITLYALSQHR